MAFEQTTFDAICERIATGESLREICSSDGMPSVTEALRWKDSAPERLEQYLRAREDQADHYADEILSIADDGRNDFMEKEGGGAALNAEHIQRSKLRIDARFRRMAQLRPKAYGDKLDLNHGGGLSVVIKGDDADL